MCNRFLKKFTAAHCLERQSQFLNYLSTFVRTGEIVFNVLYSCDPFTEAAYVERFDNFMLFVSS